MIKDKSTLYLAIGETFAWATIYYIFPALVLRWEHELGWSKSHLMAAITLSLVLSAAASPLAGRLIDAGRGAPMMGGACLLGAGALIFLSFVKSLVPFYVAWAVLGIAMAGSLYVPCFAIVTRARGAEAKRSIIAITLAAGFASTISFPAMQALSDAFGWRAATLGFAALAAFVAAPMLWRGAHLLEKAHGASPPVHHEESRRAFLRRPAFWFLAGGFACGALVHGAILNHLLPILDDRGVSPDAAIVAASFIGPMQVAGRLVMMAMERRASSHGFVVGTFVMMGVASAALMEAGGTPGLIVAFVVLFGSAHGLVSILRPVIAREVLGGNNFGAKNGAFAVPYLIGSATAPYIGALIWGIGGYDAMLGVLIVLSMIGCMLYLIARRLSVQS